MTRLESVVPRALVVAGVVLGLSVSKLAAQSTASVPASEGVVAVATVTQDSSVQASVADSAVATRAALITASPAGITIESRRVELFSQPLQQDTGPRRRAVAYSDWYSRRLTVHRYGSYVMLPLFVTQYVLGSKILGQKEDQYAGTRLTPIDKNLKSAHTAVAGGVGALFLVNTTTGLWNLIESRHTEEGRTRRTIHALTMLAADAGFVYTGVLGSRASDRGPPQGRTHRNMALTSFGISTAGAALMWFGNR